MKIVTIVGARPQFIKAAPVSRLLRAQENIQEVFIHTGQHYADNMSQVFFDELELPIPDYNLGVGSASHATQTGQMLTAMEAVLLNEKPDWVIVYGDTNSTLAGALVASKLHIPVAHIEAGLRSFNRRMPEEINRIVADQLADILFTPTYQAAENLKKEGFLVERIKPVGDVMYDAAVYFGMKAEKLSKILQRLSLPAKKYILATIHRQENTDNQYRLETIFHALALIAENIPIVLPLHPRTRKMLLAYGLFDKLPSNLKLIEPVGFLDMIMLEKNACLIMTDSGGIQKEAFFYHVPCITLRDETEWVELVNLGWNLVLPPVNALSVYNIAMQELSAIRTRDINEKPYGDGCAAAKIVEEMMRE
jgi:UDP-GlcNAc3NAcA epimerase